MTTETSGGSERSGPGPDGRTGKTPTAALFRTGPRPRRFLPVFLLNPHHPQDGQRCAHDIVCATCPSATASVQWRRDEYTYFANNRPIWPGRCRPLAHAAFLPYLALPCLPPAQRKGSRSSPSPPVAYVHRIFSWLVRPFEPKNATAPYNERQVGTFERNSQSERASTCGWPVVSNRTATRGSPDSRRVRSVAGKGKC